MSPLRIWLVGFGTVGRWLAGALDAQAERLASRYGCAVQVVGIANARDGFAYRADGIDLAAALAAAGAGRRIGALTGLLTMLAAWSGGILSLVAISFVLVPLEAALSASRRTVIAASMMVAGAVGVLMLLGACGLLNAQCIPQEQLSAFALVAAQPDKRG